MEFLPLGVSIILIIWCGVLTYFIFQQKGSLGRITSGGKKETVIDILSEVLEREKNLESGLKDTNRKVEGLLFDSQFYIQKIGLVRFNSVQR